MPDTALEYLRFTYMCFLIFFPRSLRWFGFCGETLHVFVFIFPYTAKIPYKYISVCTLFLNIIIDDNAFYVEDVSFNFFLMV